MYSVPIVDLAPFPNTSGSDNVCQQRAQELYKAVCLNGCAAISGQEISNELVQQALAVSHQTFRLPYADKMKAPHPNIHTLHRGYSKTGRGDGARDRRRESEAAVHMTSWLQREL